MKSLVKKWFFSENASIHDRALVPPILPFLLAFIAGLLGNVAKFFIAPYLACAITLILAIFLSAILNTCNDEIRITHQYPALRQYVRIDNQAIYSPKYY